METTDDDFYDNTPKVSQMSKEQMEKDVTNAEIFEALKTCSDMSP